MVMSVFLGINNLDLTRKKEEKNVHVPECGRSEVDAYDLLRSDQIQSNPIPERIPGSVREPVRATRYQDTSRVLAIRAAVFESKLESESEACGCVYVYVCGRNNVGGQNHV